MSGDISPAWRRAKMVLFSDLERLSPLTSLQRKILLDWFKYNFFEVGCSQIIDEEILQIKDFDKDGFLKSIRRQATMELADGISKTGLIKITEIPDGHGRRRCEFRVLLAGVPFSYKNKLEGEK